MLELSRRCTSMSNWYGAIGWALCSLLDILWWNHWKCQRPWIFPVPVSCAINILVVFKRQFLPWLCKIEADAWFWYFCQVLDFAEIEEIGVALPDGAWRTPASFISSPGCLWLKAGGIVVALAGPGGVVTVGLCYLLLAYCLLWLQGRGHWRGGRSKGCWDAWPAWWGVNKHALFSICCKSARKRMGKFPRALAAFRRPKNRYTDPWCCLVLDDMAAVVSLLALPATP